MNSLGIFINALLFLTGCFQTGLVGPNRRVIEDYYNLSHTHFGLGMAAIQVTAVSAVLLSAGRLRHFHPLRMLQAALLAIAGGLLLIGMSSSLWLMGLGWALASAGGALASITNNLSMDLWPLAPGRGVVLLHSFNATGKLVGPLIAAAFVMGVWRYSFLVMGLLPVGMLVGSCFVHRALIPGGRESSGHSPFSKKALANPVFWLILGCFGLISGGEAAFATLLPAYFQSVRHMAPDAASLLLTIHLGGLVCGRFVIALVPHRFSANTILLACLSCGIFVVPVMLAESVVVRNLSLFALGFMFSATWPTFYARASMYLADHRDILAYGSGLGNAVGVSFCVLLSSVIADINLSASLWFGPLTVALFALVYVLSPLLRLPENGR